MKTKIISFAFLGLSLCSFGNKTSPQFSLEEKGAMPAGDEIVNGVSSDPDSRINAIADNGKFIWIGTNKGLLRINKKSKQSTSFNKANSPLPSDYVTAICCGENGNVWIGTSNGILRYDNFTFILINSENSGLPDNHITSLVVDSKKNLWIGTFFGGLVQAAGNNHFRVFNHLNAPMAIDCIFSLSADSKGNVWAGIFLNGLLKVSDASLEMFDASNSGLSEKNISFVQEHAHGKYIVGTNEGFFYEFDGKNFLEVNRPLVSKDIRSASVIEKTGQVLVLCVEGISVLKKTSTEDGEEGLFYNNIASLLVSRYLKPAQNSGLLTNQK